jgi:putative YhdH/YhfP family quinone oxidoreductase
MLNTEFQALVVEQTQPKEFRRSIQQRTLADLPPGDVLIRVDYSSLNFKDALSATGNPGVTRNFPHTPGIDAAGTVVQSSSDSFQVGDAVIATSYDLGMNTPGGLGQYIRVPSQWVLPLPKTLTAFEAMSFGTAGLTAALMINALLDNGLKSAQGPILVTGATGGVGSLAVAILAKLGFSVSASTGKLTETSFLMSLGASEVIDRASLLTDNPPLQAERWAGVIDVVAGPTLANAIQASQYNGVVTCSGLVGALDLTTSIFPFILRGVRLIGIDSVQCSMAVRTLAWQRLAGDFKPACLPELTTEISLEQVEDYLLAMLAGKSHGRVVVNMKDD